MPRVISSGVLITNGRRMVLKGILGRECDKGPRVQANLDRFTGLNVTPSFFY